MIQFLKCAVGAAVKPGVKFLVGLVPGGDVLIDVVEYLADVCERWKKLTPDEAARREELQTLARISAEQVRQEVQDAVQAEAGAQPVSVQQALTAYLTQVPAMIRRSLRSPSDPGGTTVPPTFSLQKPEDLLPFLPPRTSPFKPGDKPQGVPWVLEELLGVGGFGEVWKARDPKFKSIPPVALKFCLDAKAAKTLRHEAGVLDRVMQQGHHPGIVPLQKAYLDAEPPCLEYEYVAGGDLAGLIQEQYPSGELTLQRVRQMVLALAQTVAFAHQLNPSIVHRDLKPANILVQYTPEGEPRLRITDFGIGGVAATQALQQADGTSNRLQNLTLAGPGGFTPLYASPQQIRGEPPDPRDDVHALGVIWYQLLTGDLTQGVPSGVRWLNDLKQRGLSEPLVTLLASCVEYRPSDRPASAIDLADRLTKLLTIPPPPPPVKLGTLPIVGVGTSATGKIEDSPDYVKTLKGIPRDFATNKLDGCYPTILNATLRRHPGVWKTPEEWEALAKTLFSYTHRGAYTGLQKFFDHLESGTKRKWVIKKDGKYTLNTAEVTPIP